MEVTTVGSSPRSIAIFINSTNSKPLDNIRKPLLQLALNVSIIQLGVKLLRSKLDHGKTRTMRLWSWLPPPKHRQLRSFKLFYFYLKVTPLHSLTYTNKGMLVFRVTEQSTHPKVPNIDFDIIHGGFAARSLVCRSGFSVQSLHVLPVTGRFSWRCSV